jgi:hypothetical protein
MHHSTFLFTIDLIGKLSRPKLVLQVSLREDEVSLAGIRCVTVNRLAALVLCLRGPASPQRCWPGFGGFAHGARQQHVARLEG